MPLSTQTAVSNGTLALLPISISYLDRSEITVHFNGVLATTGWFWVGTSDHTIAFSPVVLDGVVVQVRRNTDLSAPRHIFTTGAAFTAASLDEDIRQILHISQEARENTAGVSDVYTDLNMHGYNTKLLRPAVTAGEAVEYTQFNTAITNLVGSQANANTVATAAATATAAASAASASAAAAAGAAGLAANYATLASITDYGSITGVADNSDYGSI